MDSLKVKLVDLENELQYSKMLSTVSVGLSSVGHSIDHS